MSRDVAMYLYDMQRAAKAIREFCRDKTYPQYSRDLLLRSAVERQFEIIGEALNKLGRLDPAAQARVRDYRNIISFRNILIHGYAELDDGLVWSAVIDRLPQLETDVNALIAEFG
ncbi:hypothetical protein SAOR_09595 [Salinisphaera orenii MK-B5]|uniref:Nucleotidyltransferase n=1 Tax=Salinisphaera orenii MK-B5 TaxID=856730 RepID=A0A423PN61_9GAMM|nr:HepT-like ribonuclease domain-containing protein [Salinisphaera orenii]ROO27054.1 hypothetical protein SAOR_09595 [Salinisphaera orenii MK-B5]